MGAMICARPEGNGATLGLAVADMDALWIETEDVGWSGSVGLECVDDNDELDGEAKMIDVCVTKENWEGSGTDVDGKTVDSGLYDDGEAELDRPEGNVMMYEVLADALLEEPLRETLGEPLPVMLALDADRELEAEEFPTAELPLTDANEELNPNDWLALKDPLGRTDAVTEAEAD